jgi:hypothetical protein
LTHTSIPFCSGYFGDGVFYSFGLASNWHPPDLSLPSSHWCPAWFVSFNNYLLTRRWIRNGLISV